MNRSHDPPKGQIILQKILIIKLRHHGDVLLTTPLFDALNTLHPNCLIDALVYQETQPMLQGNPHLHQVLTINRALKGWQRLQHECQLLRQIRKTGYDAVIHLTDQWIGALIARTSGATLRIGTLTSKRQTSFWKNSFTHCVSPPPRGNAHAVELNLLCLQHLGVNPAEVQGRLHLHPTPEAQNKALNLLHQHGLCAAEHTPAAAPVNVLTTRNHQPIHPPFVLIHPAARWPFKCWEDERFAEVVHFVLQQGFNVVLTSSPDAQEVAMTKRVEELARPVEPSTTLNQGFNAPHLRHELHHAPQPLPNCGQLINLAGQTSLPVLVALLQRCAFYIGVDSAPMHMAAALDVPQIALFGPSWVAEWRPWSDKAQVIYAGDFGPLPHPDSINTDDATRLLNAIPTQVVIKHLKHLIQQQ